MAAKGNSKGLYMPNGDVDGGVIDPDRIADLHEIADATENRL